MLERRGTPFELHGITPNTSGRRLVCLCLPESPAVVIGSAQRSADFDAERLSAAGLELVRRRSGGGAVLVAPFCQVWLDVFVPSGDELAHADVGRSFYWLGEIFAEAIRKVLSSPAEAPAVTVHRGPTIRTPLSKVLCYAGLGAGEVCVAGRKVVGMSQRREHSGSWIHSMALLGQDGATLAELLNGPAGRRSEARALLGGTGLAEGEHLLQSLTEELLNHFT